MNSFIERECIGSEQLLNDIFFKGVMSLIKGNYLFCVHESVLDLIAKVHNQVPGRVEELEKAAIIDKADGKSEKTLDHITASLILASINSVSERDVHLLTLDYQVKEKAKKYDISVKTPEEVWELIKDL